MALQFKLSSSTPTDLTRQLRFQDMGGPEQSELRGTFLPAEWFPQSGVQLTWPHINTDWAYILDAVTDCYLRMAFEIAKRETLLIVTPEPENIQALLHEKLPSQLIENIRLISCPTNDTWARDHGFLTLLSEGKPVLLDFCFNGWGMKFAANHDNVINRLLFQKQHALKGTYSSQLDFVFEGGSIESDGCGTLLTTAECLLSANRNDTLSKAEVEQELLNRLHAQRVLWLHHGYLAGDDTDSHIDTLARFCPCNTIAYVQCTRKDDEHYNELALMEEELQAFRTADNEPYTLIPLPLPEATFDSEGNRLPATYANFLVINGAVLMPTYRQPALDEQAHKQLQKAFPKHEIVDVDCRILIEQHGSLHCCTMQFPLGVL